MPPSTLQLDYASNPFGRRRKFRRRLLQILSSLAITGAIWWQGPAAYRRMLRAYWEHRVEEYTAPSDRIIYEEDPAGWPALLSQSDYKNMSAYSSPGWNSFVAYSAQPVKRLADVTGLRLGNLALFAHSRRTPEGRNCLVVVSMAVNAMRPNAQGATPDNQVRFFGLCTSVLDGSKFHEAMPSPWIAPQSVAENRQAPLYARIYAGQIDPNDATHFTIPFEIGDYSDVLDGYLRNDETVILRPHKFDNPLNPK